MPIDTVSQIFFYRSLQLENYPVNFILIFGLYKQSVFQAYYMLPANNKFKKLLQILCNSYIYLAIKVGQSVEQGSDRYKK